jgi:hypothetical protein
LRLSRSQGWPEDVRQRVQGDCQQASTVYLLELFPFDIITQLRYLETESNALFAVHALLGILHIQEVIQCMTALFEMDHPRLLGLTVIHRNIYPALTDVGIDRGYFFTQLFFVVHSHTSCSISIASVVQQ